MDNKLFQIARWQRLDQKNPVANLTNWQSATITRDAKHVSVNCTPVNATGTARGLKLNSEGKKEIESQPEFGMGSEYNKKNKDRLFAMKKGRKKEEVDINKLNWNLEIDVKDPKDGKSTTKHYEGKRDQINEASMYFILQQTANKEFKAAPITQWYNFKPKIMHRTLTIDEADEQWERRNRIHNQSALMKKYLKAGNENDETNKREGKKYETKQGLMVYDARSGSSDGNETDPEDEQYGLI